MQITFRPTDAKDESFLRRVYASTRAAEMAMVIDWSDTQKTDFCNQQFDAQDTYYKQLWPDAEYLLILVDDQPVGRLYLDRRDDEHRIMDIALLEEHRGRGIGGRIMQDLLDEAAAVAKPVSIHVEQNNPAMRLYKRLGFEEIEEQSVYVLMRWKPGTKTG